MSVDSTEFYRGPHDGLVLNVGEIKRFCHLVRMRSEDEERLFAMMPTLLEWDRVLRGEMEADGPFDALYPYELERRGGRAAFLFRRYDEFADAAGGPDGRGGDG